MELIEIDLLDLFGRSKVIECGHSDEGLNLSLTWLLVIGYQLLVIGGFSGWGE
jgi:hypothetical protein